VNIEKNIVDGNLAVYCAASTNIWIGLRKPYSQLHYSFLLYFTRVRGTILGFFCKPGDDNTKEIPNSPPNSRVLQQLIIINKLLRNDQIRIKTE
jgi:hypothetical protein